ncbi:MAG: thioredoxin domain-containing protein [bacterium]
MSVIHISSVEEFKKEILEYKGVSIVDFRAERCGPCRMLGPIIEQLGEEHKDIKVAKVDVDKQQQLAGTFQVSSIPVVFFLKDGQVVDKVIGANPATVYKEKIAQWSAPAKAAA